MESQKDLSDSQIDDFTFEGEIGSGQFSRVYRVRHKATQKIYAMKVISKAEVGAVAFNSFVNNELRNISQINCQYIAKMYKTFDTQNCLYIVLEYVEGCSLLELVNRVGSLKEADACHIFFQLSRALFYLHEFKRIVHRDIKLENIMMTSDGQAKIIDFGFSKDLTGCCPLKTAVDCNNLSKLSTICGSISYMPPEMIYHYEYSEKVDIWSLGIVLYGMIFGVLPFFDQSSTVNAKKIVTEKLVFPKPNSPELEDLFQCILEKDPIKRYSINEVVKHSWLKIKSHSNKMAVPSKSLEAIPNLKGLSPLSGNGTQTLADIQSRNERRSQLRVLNRTCKIRVREVPLGLQFNQMRTMTNLLQKTVELPKLLPKNPI
ncbi:cAMP-dependent protein kinase catalytic subunit beta [Tritrichomonas foetus]|uniref:cAMP-dependent protein kinase catalytic subunit beta n=1 Tax=Tritrichomonas foetus TaxID=1144522 RepID=A0A1J4KKE1_9EUKA|nr:cAMP-dependent protein kinase catalytic subunit beta [Tritrichomonas foetus]|eukprot:OHT11767.1 cAMP-dependent protein kinase catalytic subunit beta [Tritrichomonas foetus]